MEQAEKGAGGAPILDVLVLGGAMSAVVGAWLWVLLAYRRGGAGW